MINLTKIIIFKYKFDLKYLNINYGIYIFFKIKNSYNIIEIIFKFIFLIEYQYINIRKIQRIN